jgi:hypothetical protein
MKALVLLALSTLAALPLSAHEHWREPHRLVVEAPRCAPYPRWEAGYRHDRWDSRWEHRGWYRQHDWDDRVFPGPLPRPLGPPFVGRVELRFH